MKKLQNFKAQNLTEDQMRKVVGGARDTTYSTVGGGSGTDTADNGVTTFTSGDSNGETAKGDTRTSR